MEKMKSIQATEKNWKAIQGIRIDKGLASMNEVLTMLLTKWKPNAQST